MAQAVLTKRDAPLFGTFARDDYQAMLAGKIAGAQSKQLGQADAGVIEHPEDGPVAGCGAVCQGTNFSRRGTGDEQTLKLFWLDGPDEGLADLRKRHTIKGIALNRLAVHQPVEEGSR